MESLAQGIEALGREVVPDTELAEQSTLRTFLHTVLEFRDGNVAEAADWLKSPNNALSGQSPVELIQSGNTKRLHDFWNSCGEIYGG